MSKTAEQILTFDAFMADQQLTTIKDGTEIHGDPNKQTVVAFNPIKPFVDIAFKLKPECHGIAFQNVKFICETLFCYLTIRFNILSDYCTFTDCHFDINIKFCPRYNKVVRLDNCKASPAAKLDFFDGSIFINDCDFHLNQVTFSRCSNIHGVKTKFNNMGIYDTGNINVTFRYCNISAHVLIQRSQIDNLDFDGCELKCLNITSCHINKLKLIDYSNCEKTYLTKVDIICIYYSLMESAIFTAKNIKEIQATNSMISNSVLYDQKLPKVFSVKSTGFSPTQKHMTLYKKALAVPTLGLRNVIDHVIVKLEVPDNAKKVLCGSKKNQSFQSHHCRFL